MFIDLHQHFVHGMDDGASSFRETTRMLKAAHQDAVTHIFATPHIAPGRRPFDLARFSENFGMARDFCRTARLPVTLYTGSEIMYTDETLRLLQQGVVPTLAGTNFILVEFPFSVSNNQLQKAGRRLSNAGFIPIYAHVERYNCIKTIGDVRNLKDIPNVRLQVNAQTMLKSIGFFRGHLINNLFREGLIDYIATDAHNVDTRPTNMQACFAAVTARFGRENAQRWMYQNQQEILCAAQEGTHPDMFQ